MDYKLTYRTVLLWTIKESKPGVEPQYCSAELTYKDETFQDKTFTGPNCKADMTAWIETHESWIDEGMAVAGEAADECGEE